MINKDELRKIYRQKRRDVPDKQRKSAAAANILLNCERLLAADVILAYASINSEADTSGLIIGLLEMGKKVALPVSLDNGIMNFYQISSYNSLIKGRYGIPEPPLNTPVTVFTDKTVCIVPGLAFDTSGTRMGYGGGYYDRFLAKNPQIYSIGYTYQDMLIPSLPAMSHDIRVNAVATEERLVSCNAEQQ
jgi:5-formyltetrahydrofolate cyclo-ligase